MFLMYLHYYFYYYFIISIYQACVCIFKIKSSNLILKLKKNEKQKFVNFTKLPALTPIPYIIPYPVISYVFFDEKMCAKYATKKH